MEFDELSAGQPMVLYTTQVALQVHETQGQAKHGALGVQANEERNRNCIHIVLTQGTNYDGKARVV